MLGGHFEAKTRAVGAVLPSHSMIHEIGKLLSDRLLGALLSTMRRNAARWASIARLPMTTPATRCHAESCQRRAVTRGRSPSPGRRASGTATGRAAVAR